ncbi:SCO3933 family regulatory protein [Streptomyces parvus]|uniref:SCO3933 family regulatory protein n=1 Tax=Streptomyces parvus TaxID=66428 RepID=UPI003406A91E
MARIPVLVKPTDTYITGTGGAPKIKNPETGEIATDRDTGETLYTVTVMQMSEGRAEILKITVPGSGLPAGLAPGVMVRPVDLIATPWARIFNGGLSDGVAYRVTRLELVQIPAMAAPAETVSESAAAVKKAA